MCSGSCYAYGFLIAFLTLIVAVSRTFFYTVTPTVHKNRLSLLLTMFKPLLVLHVTLLMFIGGFMMYYLSGLMGDTYDSLVVPCEEGKFCLNEYHLFVVIYGLFLGILYGSSFFLYGEDVITFPPIQPLKFFQVKSHILPSLASALRATLWHNLYFYIFYFFFGCIIRFQFVTALGLHGSLVHMDSLLSMLDLQHFWFSWISGAFIFHLWKFSSYLFKIYNTEAFHFPIESSIAVHQDTCLDKVMANNTIPFVCYHAYQDLCDLAENSSLRRKQIYTLSQPGGHPHNWLNISTQCLALIDTLTNSLKDNITKGFDKTFPLDGRVPLIPPTNLAYTTTLSDTASPPRTPKSATSESSFSSGHRDSTFGHSQSMDGSQLYSSFALKGRPPIRSVSSTSYQSPVKQPVVLVKNNSFTRLRDRLIPKRLWEVWPEAASRLLFVNCQLHIWALEALSSLVAFSFHEDTFGVVQTNLPDILISLLALNNVIEKHQKMTQLNWETLTPSQDSIVLQSSNIVAKLRRDLRATVKTSLHRIVAVFGTHLKSIPLSSDYRKQLQQLMDYKE